MGRRLKRVSLSFVVGLVVLFVVAQLVRPARTNPPTEPSRTLQAHPRTTSELVQVMNRSCSDCHSNNTEWSRYTNVAPMSWVVVMAVNKGRKAMNISDWASYSADDQRELLFQSCKAVQEGKMPGGIYTRLRPEATLSSKDIDTICGASRTLEASAKQ